MKQTEEYKFKIFKKDNFYLAECEYQNHTHFTYGKTEEEVFEMVADLFMTIKEIKISMWSRFWHKLLRLK